MPEGESTGREGISKVAAAWAIVDCLPTSPIPQGSFGAHAPHRDGRGPGERWCTSNTCDARSQGAAVFSLIRLSPPRHGIRHEKRGVIRHPATKVVAAPLVTATAVAMDYVDSSAQTQVADGNATPPTAPPRHLAAPAAPTTTVTTPASTTTIAVPPSTTSTTNTTTHLWPTSTAPPAPRHASPAKVAAKAPAK